MTNGEKKYPFMLRFIRHDFSRYIAHLDWIRIVQTTLDRTGLPLIYTEGFSPKAKLKFSPPLPVGLASDCELVMIFLGSNLKIEQIQSSMSDSMPDGMSLAGVHYMYPSPPKNPFQSINAALYEMVFHDTLDQKIRERILEVYDNNESTGDELHEQSRLIVKVVNRDEFLESGNRIEYVAQLEEKRTFHAVKFAIALKNSLELEHVPEGKKIAFLNIDQKGARKLFQF